MIYKNSKKIFIVTGIALFFGVFAVVAYADNAWGNFHWARTSNPLALNVGDNVSSAWDDYLSEASSDWSVSEVLDTTIVPGTALRHRSPNLDCSPVSGTVQVCNKTYGKTGWLGLAQIWASGDHIVKGTAKLNDTYFNTTTYNTPAWRRLVMCQEVAHNFGLDHQDEIFNNANLGSCMDYTNDPDGGPGGFSATDPSNEHPNAHDYAQLESIYEHVESTSTASSAVSPRGNGNGSGVNLDDPSAWGRAVKQDGQGRNSLYERDLGNGEKLFTFVIWAD